MRQGFAPVLILVIIGVLVGAYIIIQPQLELCGINNCGGFYTRSNPPPTFPPSLTPEVLEKNEMADWKVYVNTEFDYKVKYPSQWIFVEASSEISPQESCCIRPLLEGEFQKVTFVRDEQSLLGSFTIRVYKNTDSFTLDEWSKRKYVFITANGEEKDERSGGSNLNGYESVTASRWQYDSTKFAIATLYKGNFYEIEFDESNPNDDNFYENEMTYHQILSTFEFTNNTTDSCPPLPTCNDGEKLVGTPTVSEDGHCPAYSCLTGY